MNLRRKFKISFKFINWKTLILIAIAILYSVQFATLVINGRVPVNYGDDFFAYWSVGKIADDLGYGEIYDLNVLKHVQIDELIENGLITDSNTISLSPTPVPIFSFVVPFFRLLSFLPIDLGFLVWTLLSVFAFIGYLLFFVNKISSGKTANRTELIIISLLSFCFFMTIGAGQINVFLMICMGEFVRNGYEQKTFASGLWLGGLLLKPQLLILIIPILFILHYWKPIWGFLVSSFVVLGGSFLLSGIRGMQKMVNLWFEYSEGLATNAVEYMVNWRMLGQNVNSLFHTSLGWIITVVGMLITLILVLRLVWKVRPVYGSPVWVLVILGVFSATTIITWHSHYHMSLILVPLLIFVTSHRMLHQRYYFVWVIVTPIVILIVMILSILSPEVAALGLIDAQGVINAFLGLALNLMLLFCTVQKSLSLSLT